MVTVHPTGGDRLAVPGDFDSFTRFHIQWKCYFVRPLGPNGKIGALKSCLKLPCGLPLLLRNSLANDATKCSLRESHHDQCGNEITMRKATPARLERPGFGNSGAELGGGVSRGRSLGWVLIVLPPRLSGCLR